MTQRTFVLHRVAALSDRLRGSRIARCFLNLAMIQTTYAARRTQPPGVQPFDVEPGPRLHIADPVLTMMLGPSPIELELNPATTVETERAI
jgi:hypothetical protein